MSDLTSRNKALMRRIYEEMWNQNRVSVAREIFQRPEGVERFVREFLMSFPDLQHRVQEMIVEEDRVAVCFAAHGTHTGQWTDFTPTGIAIHYTGVTVARIADDKIIEHQTWWDKAGLRGQLEGART